LHVQQKLGAIKHNHASFMQPCMIHVGWLDDSGKQWLACCSPSCYDIDI
jgi:hypothetical protein